VLIEIVLILIIALFKKVSYKRLLSCGGIAAGVVVTAALLSGNTFISYFNSIVRNTGAYSTDSADNIFLLTGIDMEGEHLTFHSEAVSLTVYNDLGEYVFYNTDGEVITPNFKDGIFSFGEAEFSAISIVDLDTVLIFDFGYADTIEFDSVYDHFAYIGINGYLHFEITESGISPQLQSYYGFATGRGYIWLNTLPIAKECLVIGKGAGNFPFYFPQNNVTESLNVNGTSALLNEKPHSLYLQLWVTFGLPALVCFLLLIFAIVLKSGKKIISDNSDNSNKGIPNESGYIIAVIAFMICGLVNDSSVATSPLFWIYSGLMAIDGS
jgi:hypothetical protein